jgi:DnaK suppressor protein
MPSILTPAPQRRPKPDLTAHLPVLREILEEQRQFRLDQIAELTDQTVPEIADARFQVSQALAAAARQALVDLDAALARMDAGRYGACRACARQIDLERLYVIPQASECTSCQRTAAPATPR